MAWDAITKKPRTMKKNNTQSTLNSLKGDKCKRNYAITPMKEITHNQTQYLSDISFSKE